MQNNNVLSNEEFIKTLNNDRHIQLANMILSGETFEAMEKVGFAKIIVQEMVQKIKANVVDQENLKVGVVVEEVAPAEVEETASPSPEGRDPSNVPEAVPGVEENGAKESAVVEETIGVDVAIGKDETVEEKIG